MASIGPATISALKALNPPARHALLDKIKIGFAEANATRYLSAIGLVVLLYDHFLTFPDEVNLVWRARRSLAKFAFLLNKYAVILSLLAVTCFLNDWSARISDEACRSVLGTTSVIGVISVGVSDGLVLQRVVALWDGNRTVMRTMTVVFLTTFIITIVSMSLSVAHILPSVEYDPIVKICTPKTDSRVLPVVWAAPMFYEVLVLVFICLNAFDRPRDSRTNLAVILQRDGITFFLAVTALRIVNLTLSCLRNPDLVLLAVFFVWSGVTVVLNRSLLYIQRYEYTKYMQSMLINPVAAGMDHAPFRVSIEDLATFEEEVAIEGDDHDEDDAASTLTLSYV